MRHLGSGAISIVLLIAICCVVAKGTHATLLISQDVATAWTSSQTSIEVKNISNDTPDPLVNYWAIPCTTAEHIPNPNGGTIDNCWQDVGYGRWNASKLYPGDSALGYPIKSSDGISLNTVIAIPRSRNLIVYDGLLRILPNFQSNFKPVRTLTGAISYMQLTTDVFSKTNRPHFSDGSFATTVQPGSYGFSVDGMHLSYNKGAYQVMVNTDTMVATKFGTNSQQSSGVTPKVATALSERGEVGFVANKDFNKYGLYDLNHCQPASDTTLPGVCPTRDVYQLLTQKIPGFRYINTTRFLSDTRIEFYAVVDSGGALHTNRYELRLPQNYENNLQYLAMGDSYTSGEGLGNYRTGTDSSENHCHTSLDSYPYLIKAEMGFTRADSVVCASAKVKDIYTLNAKFYNSSEDGRQATGMEDDSFDTQIYQGFLPGYRIQESFIRAYRPRRATLSIGGNNIKFSEILKNCVMPGDCYSSDTEKVEFVSRLKALFPKLVDTYRAAIAEMPTYGRLYVFGYPYMVDNAPSMYTSLHTRGRFHGK